ncbi:MAG: 23S rRNA (pseudouridine(1915)-N(3))-methyltransferase RlmH [Cytophagaceae bacterium]|nr:23S rRNA (pseudouridine(1915)-N(3))-methyltransferase RlmH [Cytophagaceae bacterium]MDW8455648.1 23S rRNA (pseudouridine(1915)-N(3))-methyltransferase RlmH [Cytophagaceae bacterium]
MKIVLLLCGKTEDKHWAASIEDYSSRIAHYVKFETVIIHHKHSAGIQKEQIKNAEAEKILAHINAQDYVVALDEKGNLMTSQEFSGFLQKQMNKGHKRIVFIIGGAYGLAPAVYNRSDEILSLSPMTFTHQMARVFFVEQLYRAFTILNGEKYHH